MKQQSSTMKMVLMAGGLVGAVVGALLIKEHVFDRTEWVEAKIVGAPCMDGLLDQTISIKISGDDFSMAQPYRGGMAGAAHSAGFYPLTISVPADPGVMTAEISACRDVSPTSVDCARPTRIGGTQTVTLEQHGTDRRIRVMFPGDLTCRR